MKQNKVYKQCNKMCSRCKTKENGCVGIRYCSSWQRLRKTITTKQNRSSINSDIKIKATENFLSLKIIILETTETGLYMTSKGNLFKEKEVFFIAQKQPTQQKARNRNGNQNSYRI